MTARLMSVAMVLSLAAAPGPAALGAQPDDRPPAGAHPAPEPPHEPARKDTPPDKAPHGGGPGGSAAAPKTGARPDGRPDPRPGGAAPGPAGAGAGRPAAAVPFPHPLITEVLYAVPTGEEGDANGDGKREVSGDEFIELVNPHDRAIQLKGYTLTDGAPSGKAQLKFVLPALELPPGGVVVVFNGHDSKVPGPVGDAKAAAGKNEKLHGAYVLVIRPASSRASFSNAGDAAVLRAPSGAGVQRVRWGKATEKTGGASFPLDEEAPTTAKGSVSRDGTGKDGAWKSTRDLDDEAFTPGRIHAP